MASQSVVLLNVGGHLFTTTTATLTSPLAIGSMLEKLVDLHLLRLQVHTAQHVADAMQPTLSDPRHPDALFIDRNGSTFGYVLDYLRDGGSIVLPADLHTTQQLLREAQYYQLTGLVQLLQQHMEQLKAAEHSKTATIESIDTYVKVLCASYCNRDGYRLYHLLDPESALKTKLFARLKQACSVVHDLL